ncbi:MAG: small-conductance mechanosensitive channel [Candidatus Omnitrophota bacterium]|jgi:small-conductance mechanosensitive channel
MLKKEEMYNMRLNRRFENSKLVFLILILLGTFLATSNSYANEEEKDLQKQVIKLQEIQTKEKIAEKKESIDEVVQEAEKALAETNTFKEVAALKEKEAVLKQREATVLENEAEATNDKDLKREAEDARKKAGQLSIEANASKEKLKIYEAQAKLNQEKIDQETREVESLKKELYQLKLKSAGLGQIARWMNHPIFNIGETPVSLGGIASSFFIMFIAFLLSGLSQKVLSSRLSKGSKLKSGSIYAIGRVAHYFILVIGSILAAQCVGLNLGSLAVVFGFLSVGIGFGLQNITSNFISGLILLFERPISVGDFVTVDSQLGTVREINMRSSLIETQENIRIIVPNSKFIEGNVINWSHGNTRVRINCPVGVAYGSDVSKVKEALMGVAMEHEMVMKHPPPAVRFIGFGDSSLDFRLLMWINDPEEQYAIKSDINFGIDAAFRRAGIQIPFPQRDLHIKTPIMMS